MINERNVVSSSAQKEILTLWLTRPASVRILLIISYIKMNNYIIYTEIQYIFLLSVLFARGQQYQIAVGWTSTVAY